MARVKIDQIGSIPSRDYGMGGVPSEMEEEGARFLDGHTEIAPNPSTRQATRFPILIKARNTAFLTPFTQTP